ncbi:hypothetical protein BDP27DRAFT_1369224 [Rhodocollybia butyracea]|uniref:Uncharacterized protein n=1 Tax=Rhodocollybia butyracea TaxID=206335 RepID=A0A9P5PBG3_9AGAR|nr:hypothetical protein BDP27DRAFT_1369224 [Rhodocollybia butyracea]
MWMPPTVFQLEKIVYILRSSPQSQKNWYKLLSQDQITVGINMLIVEVVLCLKAETVLEIFIRPYTVKLPYNTRTRNRKRLFVSLYGYGYGPTVYRKEDPPSYPNGQTKHFRASQRTPLTITPTRSATYMLCASREAKILFTSRDAKQPTLDKESLIVFPSCTTSRLGIDTKNCLESINKYYAWYYEDIHFFNASQKVNTMDQQLDAHSVWRFPRGFEAISLVSSYSFFIVYLIL